MAGIRVLIIGLDGGTLKKLKLWLDNKELPLLSRLYSEGCHAQLRSFFPTLSPLEWACFYTGKSPGKLGLFALSHVEDLKDPLGSWQVIDSSVIRARSLWGILSDQGTRVGVVNIPATYPPEKVQGFIITGYLTPPSAVDFFYPEPLRQYLNGYMIESDFDYLPDKSINTDELLKDLHLVADRRTNVMISILRDYKVQLLAVNFKEVDTLQHVFWDDNSTILKFMKSVDAMISKLVEAFGPTHIVVMSDHGFHEAESEYFYINTWLKTKGLLTGATGLRGRFWTAAYGLAMALSKRSKLIRSVMMSRRKLVSKYAGLQIDLSGSMAYGSQWGIFFSPQVRARPDYEQIRGRLSQELLSARSPSGYNVFESVYKREDLFQGEFLDRFPDLIPIPEPRFLVNPNLFEKAFDLRIDRPYLKGAHKSDPYGIFILWGDGVKSGLDLGTVALTDIAPTVLSIFGFNPPADMDGRILKEALAPDFIARTQQTPIDEGQREQKERRVYSEEEQDQIMEHLRRLGYV